MNDTWGFYKDNQGQWRWRRTAPNGNIVGSASEGYVNKSDCEGNARRNGWETEEMIEQDLKDENKIINKKVNALYEDRGDPGVVEFMAEYEAERKTEKKWREKHHSSQRKLLILITTLSSVIILILLLMIFTKYPPQELSDINSSELKTMVSVPLVALTPAVPPVPVVTIIERYIVFSDIHFAFNQARLSTDILKTLDANVETLKSNPALHVRIAGCTSASGTVEENQILSENRAEAVLDYLLKWGIEAERLTVIGYGRTKPAAFEVDPTDLGSKEARANMRVLFETVAKT